LLGDFVTLFCWRLSRKPPSERYPYGFAKFETLGTTTISILLIGGALGVGFHSYHLLIVTLSETAANLPSGLLQDVLQFVTSSVPLPKIGHEHVHAVDPNAAWFAAVSVLTKEWLYRITKAVADEEKSPVLLANAIHHRSDAYSSVVAFFAILGTWFFPAFPLDPFGGKHFLYNHRFLFISDATRIGLLVSIIILRQGFDLLKGAWGDLTDAGVSPQTRQSLLTILEPLVDKSTATHQHKTNFSNSSLSPSILSIQHLRARRSGSLMFVDLTAEVPGSVTVTQASTLEEKIARTLKKAKKEITEVRVTFKPHSSCTKKSL
jgi:divalent metal cation (Fe/Co/Zn/Cd) transporter